MSTIKQNLFFAFFYNVVDCTTFEISPASKVISAVSIATSAPVLIAIQISALANAGASLTPSPHIATTSPFACNSLMICSF
jgi:cation transport ATPase